MLNGNLKKEPTEVFKENSKNSKPIMQSKRKYMNSNTKANNMIRRDTQENPRTGNDWDQIFVDFTIAQNIINIAQYYKLNFIPIFY